MLTVYFAIGSMNLIMGIEDIAGGKPTMGGFLCVFGATCLVMFARELRVHRKLREGLREAMRSRAAPSSAFERARQARRENSRERIRGSSRA